MLNQKLLQYTEEANIIYQTNLFGELIIEEDPKYLTHQLLTYIGNKRRLIHEIDSVFSSIKTRIGKNTLRLLDAFSGSGVVSRYFKKHASFLATIDLEEYATIVSRCYLANRSETNLSEIRLIINDLNKRVDNAKYSTGFIEELYSPKNENAITKDDRVFYTKRNAKRIDNYRRMIDDVPVKYRDMILGPLLSEASVHANTSGVFKGFHKDRHTKIGQFGGTNADALKRIKGDILLECPILSRYECDIEVHQGDANAISKTIRNLDLVYLDPPYNQHPYGSNYFMLNLIVNYQRPNEISRISGIPVDWNRSDYNNRTRSSIQFYELLESLDTKFILVSFNDEGFITRDKMISMLEKIGKLDIIDIKYNTYRGCRNIENRSKHVTEQLFIVEKR